MLRSAFNKSFFSPLLKVVSHHSKGTVILMGDSNISLNSFLHRQYPRARCLFMTLPKKRKCTLSYKQLVLLTYGRNYIQLQDFTFFSHPHNSFCRIDLVLMLIQHLPLVKMSQFLPHHGQTMIPSCCPLPFQTLNAHPSNDD